MKLVSPKQLVYSLILLTAGFYCYLTFPYLSSLIKYYSLSGSGLVYSIKGREKIRKESLVIKPVSPRFSLLITKLGLNEAVAREIDFYDSEKLDSGLRMGLVHVKTSALPGDFGTVLIVGHPLYSFFNFSHSHPEFYLIDKLEVGDEAGIFYEGVDHRYRVVEKRLEPPTYLDFFTPGEERKLMLVSGYPAGMAFRFLVIEAEEIY